jgi:hypothetical protein
MSGRCKSCNEFMSEEVMCRKFPPDGDGNREYSDMCGQCHEEVVAILYNNYTERKWYMDCEEFGYKGILGIHIDGGLE